LKCYGLKFRNIWGTVPIGLISLGKSLKFDIYSTKDRHFTMIIRLRFIAFFTVILISSCNILRLLSLNKILFKAPIVAQHNFKEEKKFRFIGGWIYIYAKINGSDSLEFMLDTGSPSFISFGTKDSLNIKSKKIVDSLEYCSLNTQIGNINYQNTSYMVFNVYSFKRLIGVNLMQNQIWSFNFKDSIVTITDKLDYLKTEIDGFKIPFKPFGKQRTPVVKLIMNDNDTIEAFIDIGDAGFINLSSRFNLAKIKANNPQYVATALYKNDNYNRKNPQDSIAEAYTVKFNSLRIAGFRTENIVASYDPSDKGRNLVGLGFLKNFIVTIDWLNNDIYLKPIEGRKLIDNVSTYGLNIYRKHNSLRISSVCKNSEAENQGIKCGDEIESINGIEASNIDNKTIELINIGSPDNEEIILKLKNRKNPIHFKKYYLFQ
jgi:hypothetical protein